MRNLVLLLTILAFTSCRTTHMLQDDQYLVTKYKVKGASTRLTEENKLSLQPKTNRKLLGLFRLNLWLYLKANSGKENKSNWIIKNSFGEPPALLDTSVLNQNISRLNINMFNSGYFYSHSSYKIKLKKRKKTFPNYSRG